MDKKTLEVLVNELRGLRREVYGNDNSTTDELDNLVAEQKTDKADEADKSTDKKEAK